MSRKELTKAELNHHLSFQKADKDGNMFISEQELRDSLTQYGLKCGVKFSEQDIQERMRMFDLNKDGYISKDEFLFKMKQVEGLSV